MATRFVVQANLNNAVNVAQALGQFKVGVTLQTALKGGHDLVFVQAHTARTPHCQNKRPAKFLVVSSVECMNLGELFCGAICEARFGLFVGRFSGQLFAHHGLAGQFWVRTNQANLCILARIVQHLRHAVF